METNLELPNTTLRDSSGQRSSSGTPTDCGNSGRCELAQRKKGTGVAGGSWISQAFTQSPE